MNSFKHKSFGKLIDLKKQWYEIFIPPVFCQTNPSGFLMDKLKYFCRAIIKKNKNCLALQNHNCCPGHRGAIDPVVTMTMPGQNMFN